MSKCCCPVPPLRLHKPRGPLKAKTRQGRSYQIREILGPSMERGVEPNNEGEEEGPGAPPVQLQVLPMEGLWIGSKLCDNYT